MFWRCIQPLDGRYIKAYTIHDFLYSVKVCKREDADELLYTMLKEAGMSTATAWSVYKSVRLFGGSHWK